MRRHRNVKIVATLGPASSSYEMIRALFEAGADVFRLNMSHGVHEDIAKRHEIIRQVEKDVGRPIGILADLQGPKIRVSTFKDGKIWLNIGDSFTLDADLPRGEGHQTAVGLDYKELPNDVVAGDLLMLDDGRVQLEVTSVKATRYIPKLWSAARCPTRKGSTRKVAACRLTP